MAFKTSGTFLRERVARNLAEQGYELDGTSSGGQDSGEDAEDSAEGAPSGDEQGETASDSPGSEDSEGQKGIASSTGNGQTSSEPDWEEGAVPHSGEDSEPEANESGPAKDVAHEADHTTEAGTSSSASSGEETGADASGVEIADDGDEAGDDEIGDADATIDTSSGGAGAAAAAASAGAAASTSAATEAIPIPTAEDEAASENESGGKDRSSAESEDAAEDTSPATEAFAVSGTGEDTEASAESAGATPAENDEKDGDKAKESFVAAAPPSTAPFPAPAPAEEDAADGEGPSGDEEGSAPDTDGDSTADAKTSLWPAPQRFSEYSQETAESESVGEAAGDKEDAGEKPSTAGAVAGAGAVAASAAAGTAQASEEQEVGAEPGDATGPGAPEGAKGPGGPKKPGGKAVKKKRPLWWRILRPVLVVVGVFVILGIAGFVYLYTTVEVPDAAKAEATDQGSTFYFADGKTQFAERGTNRDPVSYDEMTAGGDHVVDAMISAEDRGFWDEPGVSVSGTGRAVWSTITGQQVQGGSTITQQMVRNYYEGVSREQSVARKIQEIIISIKVDQNESKQWVMEQYLNTIYFGRQAYGIQAAAEVYYHKDVDDLTPEEAAFLAAAIQQPHHYGEADVLESTDPLERRWQYVIDGMVSTGAITADEAAEMEFPVPEAERPTDGTDVSGYKGYMLQEAMNELERLGFTEDMIQRHGYEIVTTFDEDMMEAAHDAVEETVPHSDIPEGVNLGISTVDPSSGEVVAFYGGNDYLENQYDTSFHGAAQAGSAFKPYVLATALEEGYSLQSTVDGRGPRDVQGARVQNAGNDPGGVMSLIQATQKSNNLGFVDLAEQVGYENIRDTAYATGFPEGSIDDNQLVPVMPLGAVSVRPVDQASGFGTFANEGVHVEPHVIREVNNTDGDNERPEVESNQALEKTTAADVTHALQQVVNGGTGTAARLDHHPTAGKTGTTDGSVAAWFVGYTPQLSTSVGVYSGDNESFSIPGHNISGGGLPATLWKNYMARAMEGYAPGSFPQPANEGTTENWAPDTATQEPQEPEGPQEPQEPPQEEPPPEEPPSEEEPPPEEPPSEEEPPPEEPEPPEEPGIPEDPFDPGDQMARSDEDD